MRNKNIKETINNVSGTTKEIYDKIVIKKILEIKNNKSLDELMLDKIILVHLSFFSSNMFLEYESLNIYEKSIYFQIISKGLISLYKKNEYIGEKDYRNKFKVIEEIIEILLCF